jgi:diaminopimelate epimerase
MRLIKAQAYGNDFLIADVTGAPDAGDRADVARRVCDRHHGVGADGLIFVTRTPAGADSQLFNRDGSVAEVSGNGVRCVGAWLAREQSLSPGGTLTIGTAAGPKVLTLISVTGARSTMRADMGRPSAVRERAIDIGGEIVAAYLLSMGNPQCVVFGDATGLTEARLARVGGALAVHPSFPEGTNVELASLESPARLRILIWERGVGPTSSSGTGTCAAAVAAIVRHGAAKALDVTAPGGTQRVELTDAGVVMLEGWAEVVAGIEWPIA